MTQFQQCLDKLTGEDKANVKRVHQQHLQRIVKIHEEINDKTLNENERTVKQSLLKEYESQLKTYEAAIRSLVDAPDSTNQQLANGRLLALRRENNRLESHLPIYARRDDLIEAVYTNQVLILNADTGAGKSTQVVQYLADSNLAGHGEIVCTQPRRFAARALADHVAKEFGCRVGEEIGIHLDAKGPNVSKLTKIRFVTENVLLNQYRQDRMLSSYSIVIIDEAHERRIDTDLLLGVMKLCLTQRPDIKLIIMSATLDIKLINRYYPGSHVLEVTGRTYPIEDEFSQKDVDGHVNGAIQKVYEIHRSNQPGDILVFLTGPDEIDQAVADVQRCLKDAVKVLPLHGKLQTEEMTEIFEKTPLKRKIIFSTNLAETSVTIDGVQHVIDSGMVKEMIWDEKQKMQVLKIGLTTQNSVKQRRGRAGRTSPGKCYHLYTEKTLAAMAVCPRAEILTTEPNIAVLKLKHLGVVDNVENFDWVEAPSKESIRHAVHRLQWLNAIDLKSNQLTETGHQMAQLGLSPMLSAMILDSLGKPSINHVLALAGMLSISDNVWWRNRDFDGQQRGQEKRAYFFQNNGLGGDFIMLLRIFLEWQAVEVDERMAWCIENTISAKALKTASRFVDDTARQLKIAVPKFNGTAIEPKLINEIMSCVRAGFFQNLGTLCQASRSIYKVSPAGPGQHAIEARIHKFSSLYSVRSPLKHVLYYGILNVNGAKSTMTLMMILCPITPDSKMEAWQNSRSDKPVDCNFVSSTTFNSTLASCKGSILKNSNQHPESSVKPGPSRSVQEVHEKAEISSVTSESSLKDHRIVAYIPDLPATISDSKLLETGIVKFLDIKYKLKVKSINCNVQLGVGILHLQSKEDKDNLIQKIKRISIEEMPNTIVSFTSELELVSYVVIESSEAKKFPSAENISQRWIEVYQINAPLQCKTLSDQFPNIFRLVTNSFEELMKATSKKEFSVDNLLATVYFRADCCFFEDLPPMTDSDRLKVAIINQITAMKVLKTSLYIQYNKTEANAVVLSCDQARIWSSFDSIDLVGRKIMKKDRLTDRQIRQSKSTEISSLSTKTHENNAKTVVKPTSSHENLIPKLSDKLVIDNILKPRSMRGDDLPNDIKPSLHNKKPENNEINAENWYSTKMYDHKPDIMPFVVDPQHPIFQLEWNPKAFLDQLGHPKIISDLEKQRLLRVTVMINTIGIVRKGTYHVGDKKIQLQSNQLKTILYHHRSLLQHSVTKSLSDLTKCLFPSTTIRVVNEDRLIIYKKLVSEGLRPVFLNMACATSPAGGYRKGGKTQEAILFYRSNYFQSLDVKLDHEIPSAHYYCNSNGELKPLPEHDNMYPMDEFGAIYTSGLTVFREPEENGYALMDVPITDLCTIAMSAYNDPKLNSENRLTSKYSIGMRKKIENIFALAYHHRHDCLVLSAFGCGIFRNPPSHVATIFQSVIQQYAGFFKCIYFAILDDYHTGQDFNPYGNYQPFKKLLNHTIVEPSRHKMEDMMVGPWRIFNKTINGEIRLSDVRIYSHPLCNDGGECKDLKSVKHCAEYSHPSVCPFIFGGTHCDQKFDRDHILWFRHDFQSTCHVIDDSKVDHDDIAKRPYSELNISSQRISVPHWDQKRSHTNDNHLNPRHERQSTQMYSSNQSCQRPDDDIQDNKYQHGPILDQRSSNLEDAYRQIKRPSSKINLQQQHYPCERNSETDYKRHEYVSSQYRSMSCDRSSAQRYSNDSYSGNCASNFPVNKNHD